MQRRLSSGNWITDDKEDMFLDMAADFHGVTPDEIRNRLNHGQEVRYRQDDWYAFIREEPAPSKPRPAATMVRASCGHTVPEADVMSASRGTSCSRCYDRMSDF